MYHNLDKKQHELLAFSSGIDLHSNQAISLSSELCFPDVVLSEVKGTFILEHIWHHGNEILGKLTVKLNSLDLEPDYSDV